MKRQELYDTEILDKAMWNMYDTYKADNFEFRGYSNKDAVMMIEYILPYFEKIEEYNVCNELKEKISTFNTKEK